MYEAARVYLFVFGVLTIAGGVLGYVKAKSNASIVAGSVFGLALMGAGYLVARNAALGLWLGFGVSAMLTGRFSTGFRKTRKVMPAGVMTLLGILGMGITLLALAR